MRMIEPIAAYLPYMVIPGNHEIAIVSYLHLEGYKNRFSMPVVYETNSDFQQNYFWSWDYGLAHVVGIDSEHELDIPYISENQYKWLENDLKVANQNRAQRPWIIAMLHRPMYCSSSSRECGIYASELRLMLEELFVKYKVDFVLHGHIHNYERTTSVYKGVPYPSYVNPPYPVYVINGAGGNRENPAGFAPTPGPWSVTRVKNVRFDQLALTFT
jgi:3',5'-cyclic AMP phosphodiesterase CpdA